MQHQTLLTVILQSLDFRVNNEHGGNVTLGSGKLSFFTIHTLLSLFLMFKLGNCLKNTDA